MVRFWDTSAIMPLLVDEPGTPFVRPLLEGDEWMAVWWGSRTECVSALSRRQRDRQLTAKTVRERCIKDARYANAIRWQPAFKQLIYRNDEGKLIVTISQNSIGNAITELLGVVVKRVPDAAAYARAEPRLLEQLLELRRRFIEADLGEGIATPHWPAQ